MCGTQPPYIAEPKYLGDPVSLKSPVIVAALRTPIGKRGGLLASVRPDELFGDLIGSAVDSTGVEPRDIDDVIVGCATPVGEQGWNVARQAALIAGLPYEVPGVTVNRMCASSDQALRYAVQAVALGDAEFVVAGGVESMSRVPMTSDGVSFSDRLIERVQLIEQGRSAELIAERYDITRAELDAYAADSHHRAVADAARPGFSGQLVPVTADGVTVLDADEGVRPDCDRDVLASLPSEFVADGVVTAGNSSQMSDGAAVVLVASREKAEELGVRPRARVLASTTVGSDPVLQLTGVVPASRAALAKAGLDATDLAHVEVNEAFAPVPLYWMRSFEKVDRELVNPCGGAISLGHPLGATGARLLVTMLNRLEASGGRFGLQTMCIGHGMANATVVETFDK